MYSAGDFEDDPGLAVGDVAHLLRQGVLTLFLGAGTSKGFGLPEWHELTARILGRGDDVAFIAELKETREKDARQLGRLINKLDDGTPGFTAKVYNALYADVAPTVGLQLTQSPLLLGLAALTTGSCRGRVSSIFTYNYDDLLEQYLSMLGLRVHSRNTPDELSGWNDVVISYAHGYLPRRWTLSDGYRDVALSDKSYIRRAALIDEGWPNCIVHQLRSAIGLFIGLSGSDGAILTTMKRAQEKIKRESDYYRGYWLLTPDAFATSKDDILEVDMCPLRMPKEDFAPFIFRVCEAAAVIG